MVDEEKIILMTNLAVYDKNFGEKDRKINEYFVDDYVYLKNFWNRFFALIATFIIMGALFIQKFLSGEFNFATFDIKIAIFWIIVIVIFVMILYSFIGAANALKEYNVSQKRLNVYFANLKHLDNMKDFVELETEEASDDGADVLY